MTLELCCSVPLLCLLSVGFCLLTGGPSIQFQRFDLAGLGRYLGSWETTLKTVRDIRREDTNTRPRPIPGTIFPFTLVRDIRATSFVRSTDHAAFRPNGRV